jgi:hypothetical protein
MNKEGMIRMEELLFEITDICPTLNSTVTIGAVCVQDNTIVNITIPSRKKDDKIYLRSALLVEYDKIIKNRQIKKDINDVKIGDKV